MKERVQEIENQNKKLTEALEEAKKKEETASQGTSTQMNNNPNQFLQPNYQHGYQPSYQQNYQPYLPPNYQLGHQPNYQQNYHQDKLLIEDKEKKMSKKSGEDEDSENEDSGNGGRQGHQNGYPMGNIPGNFAYPDLRRDYTFMSDMNSSVIIDKLTEALQGVQKNTHGTLPPSQPTFSGNLKEDVEEFLSITEANFETYKIQDEHRVRIIRGYLRDKASAQYFGILKEEPRISWPNFRDVFKRRFRQVTYTNYMDRFLKIRQTESVSVYISEFTHLLSKIEKINDEKMKMRIFINGLKDELRIEVNRMRTKTLEEAFEVALELEQEVKGGQQNDVNMMRFKGACNICKKIGHKARFCRSKGGDNGSRNQNRQRGNRGYGNNTNNNRNENYRNNNWKNENQNNGNYGNNGNNVRNEQYRGNNWRNEQQYQGNNRNRQYNNYNNNKQYNRNGQNQQNYYNQTYNQNINRGYNPNPQQNVNQNQFHQYQQQNQFQNLSSQQGSFGQNSNGFPQPMDVGAVKTECNHSEMPKSYPLMRVAAEIGGIKTMAVIDTGASRTVISKSFVRKNNIGYNEMSDEVFVAGKQKLKTLGYTEPLEVRVNGSTCDLEMLILDMDRMDILLGLDWFDRTDAIVYPKKKLIKFDQVVTLNSAELGEERDSKEWPLCLELNTIANDSEDEKCGRARLARSK